MTTSRQATHLATFAAACCTALAAVQAAAQPARVREFLDLPGAQGLSDGELFDHVQLQPIVTVAEDGLTAKARSRTLAMTGEYESHGEWSEGVYGAAIYENEAVRRR